MPLYEKLAKYGVSLGIDNFGMIRPDDEWLEMTLALIEGGYASQVILSHDTTVLRRGIGRHLREEDLEGQEHPRDREPHQHPAGADGRGLHADPLAPFASIARGGVDEATISQIMVDNPRRMLTIDLERYPGALSA